MHRCRAQSVWQLALGCRSEADWTSLMPLCVNMQQANRNNISSPRFFMVCVFYTTSGCILRVVCFRRRVGRTQKSHTMRIWNIFRWQCGVTVKKMSPYPTAWLVSPTPKQLIKPLKRRVSLYSWGNSDAVWSQYESKADRLLCLWLKISDFENKAVVTHLLRMSLTSASDPLHIWTTT